MLHPERRLLNPRLDFASYALLRALRLFLLISARSCLDPCQHGNSRKGMRMVRIGIGGCWWRARQHQRIRPTHIHVPPPSPAHGNGSNSPGGSVTYDYIQEVQQTGNPSLQPQKR